MRKKNNEPSALPDSAIFHQLWEALGLKLEKPAREHLLYTHRRAEGQAQPLPKY